MKKLILKLACFLPIVALITADLYLPLDFFTHRVWEAIMVYRGNEILRGNFYPLIHMEKTESGDLNYKTPDAILRDVVWHTDRLGNRKKEPYAREIEIVVVGDSNIVGSSLTQADMFSEVLERQLDVGVYPLAPATPYRYLITPEFQAKPAKVLIWGLIERHLLAQVNARFVGTPPSYPIVIPETPPAWKRFMAIRFDHYFKKRPMLNNYKAKLNRFLKPKKSDPLKKRPKFILVDNTDYNVTEEDIEKAAEAILKRSEHFRSIGVQFVFLPIPSKETLYYDMLPGKERPDLIPRLVSKLKQKEVSTIDTQAVFERYRTENPKDYLYDPDETHWNATGVRVAAKALLEEVPVVSGLEATSLKEGITNIPKSLKTY